MTATKKQINYLEILFSDREFDRRTRNSWLTDYLKKEITYLDQLTVEEASRCIDKLKEDY